MTKKLTLSKQEIIDLASRYIPPEETVDFPHDNDLFCFFQRKLSGTMPVADDAGWEFGGYAVCLGYVIDEGEIPAGKWLWMHCAFLTSFPPIAQALRLQPPHAVKGRFQSPGRAMEFRMAKVAMTNDREVLSGPSETPKGNPEKDRKNNKTGKIVAFRRKDEIKRT
jgi:hypothetical protein